MCKGWWLKGRGGVGQGRGLGIPQGARLRRGHALSAAFVGSRSGPAEHTVWRTIEQSERIKERIKRVKGELLQKQAGKQ